MKIYLIIISLLFFLFPNAQTTSIYTKEVEAKITAVENNLTPWVKLDSTVNWNINDRMRELHIAGVSIAVINDYKIEWIKSYGWADTATKRPITDHTLFQIASVGKSLNAVGQMQLVQQGKLDLKKDINDYLIHWKFPYDSLSKGKKITLANLLSHTAGLSVHGFDGYNDDQQLPNIFQTLNGISPANNPPVRSLFEPGTKSEYSGGGIMISQLMLEEVTGKEYGEYMRDSVFLPLGMQQTFFSTDPPYEDFAKGYRFDGLPMKGGYMKFTEKACGGAAWSTAADIAKFVIEIQLSLKGRSNRLLNKETVNKMLTPYLSGTNSALGYFIDEKGGALYFQHSGLNPGYTSQYYGSFDGGKGVVVLSNSEMTDFRDEIVHAVATVYGWKNFFDFATKKIVKVPDSTLKKYVGAYQFEGADTGPVINYENGNLFLKDPQSKSNWRLYFTSPDEFFMLEAKWANQKFFMEQNKVGGFLITTGSYSSKVHKISN